MKRTLSLILALLLIACSLPAIITSYAEDPATINSSEPVNLAADYTYANGAVSWTNKIDPRSNLNDSKTESVFGGYSWTFGLGYADVVGNNFEYVSIKASGLKAGAFYDFSYIYQRDFVFAIDSIKNAGGISADYSTPTEETVPEKERAYKVSTSFTVPADGDYTIKLKINRDMRTADCRWDTVVLGDLVLTKTEKNNLAKNYTHANGAVTWSDNIDPWGSDYQDQKNNSVNGGYSWTFGMGNTAIGLPTNQNPAYVYINVTGLTAGTTYDFSYIYQKDYIIAVDNIAVKNGAKVELNSTPEDFGIEGGDRAHQVMTSFTAPVAGDYTITLITSRDMRPAVSNWSSVVLSDLMLCEGTGGKKVLAEVLVSGNGDATVSGDRVDAGSDVTYTAAPWDGEQFLGWYNGEEKVSDELVYTFKITENTTLSAKFTSNSLNILAGKKATDWTGWHWTTITDSSESRNGGKGYLVSKAMWQSMYTTVTLKPNTEYDFSFNWKSVQNAKGPAFPSEIMVYPVNAADINDRPNNWSDGGDGGMYSPKTGTDLEQNGGYSSNEMAKTYEWQNLSTNFTTSGETEYHVIIYFNIDQSEGSTPNEQALNISDFVLKEKGSPVAPPVNPPAGDTGLSGKDASDWTGYEWARIENSTESKNGGKGYLVTDAMHQSIYTKLTLKANTEYKLSFNWKAVQNAVCPAFPAAIKVYSVKDADIEDRTTNWINGGNFMPPNATDLEEGGGYANEEMAKTYEWQTLNTSFTTKGDTEYNLVIQFAVSGGNNHQAINLSDFVLEEVENTLPDISDKDASEWTGYEWAKIENSNESRYGGKGYLVKEAMYQNIYTSLTLKPNTKYNLSFEWKSVANSVGPAFPSEVYVTSKNDVDLKDTKNWDSSNFIGGVFDLEKGGQYGNADAAATLEWQSVAVSFATKKDTEYNLLIHFQAPGNGHQEIYLSDFKLEEVGPSEGGDEVDDTDNLAANYTRANGHVTWNTIADAWGSEYQDNKSLSVHGGYAWSFGLANSNYDTDPGYVTIKTHELEANHKYEFSFIYQKDFIMVLDSIDGDVEIIKETEDVKLLEGDRAHRVTVRFATKKAGVHNIKLKMGKGMNNENCQWSHVVLCDLKLYDITNRVFGTVKSELGGTVSGFDKAYCEKGDEITLVATPRPGNTFVGWFDADNNLVSENATFAFTAENDFNYLAVFSGNNIPNGEWLEQHGMDGTFEDGTMIGWKAEDREYGDDTSWQSFERSDFIAYNGKYSLKFNSRYRTTFYRFNDLKANTDYFLSFYVTLPDTLTYDDPELEKKDKNAEALIKWFSITSGGATLYTDTNTSCVIPGGSGWYKVNLYFNTGDHTTVDWNFYYTNKDGQATATVLKQFVYMDDIQLIEYTADTFKNGSFETGAASWRGEFDVDDGTAKIAEGKHAYQNVKFGEQTLYTVSFRAKGKGKAGASLLTKEGFNLESLISSQSAVNIDSADWEGYTFQVYSGVNPAGSVFFEATEGELLVDDIIVTKEVDRSGATVEKVDFETDRFALRNNSGVFEIYNGTEGDANVHSGTKSLRFNSANAEAGIEYLFDEAFLSSQIVSKINYRLTLYYKTAKGNTLYISPEYLKNVIDSDVQTTYTAAGNGWTKVDFIFNKLTNAYIKTLIGNILDKTNGDFYIDDITLSITPPMVVETNSANKYCEWPLNVLNNQGFEDKITAEDWTKLPATAKVRTDNGANGKNYLRVSANTRYVLPVKVAATDSYYFAVSTRLGKNSSGYVAIASDPAGTKLYEDVSGNVASKIAVDTSKWNRDAFLFTTGESGYVYLVFVATKGYIDIDDVQIYKRQYGKQKDLNDHSVFVPYNYDNPASSTVVLRGGDPTFGGKIDPNDYEDYLEDGYFYDGESGDSPSTGDDVTLPITLVILAMLSTFALLITKDRVSKKSKGGKA